MIYIFRQNRNESFDSANKVDLKPQKRNVGYLFQNYALFPTMTVAKNIAAGLKGSKEEKQKKVQEMIEKFELTGLADRLPGQLSGGQQQRVAIGRALMTRPSLILADEPTGNLDTQNTSEVIALLKETSRKYEQTILMITHNRSIAQTADRVLQVSDGCLTDFGRCRE